MDNKFVIEGYNLAKTQYAKFGINTDDAIKMLENIEISLHCWQTDDVGGFETPDAVLSGGGIQLSGNYPGKASTIEEMRQDLDKAMSLYL